MLLFFEVCVLGFGELLDMCGLLFLPCLLVFPNVMVFFGDSLIFLMFLVNLEFVFQSFQILHVNGK